MSSFEGKSLRFHDFSTAEKRAFRYTRNVVNLNNRNEEEGMKLDNISLWASPVVEVLLLGKRLDRLKWVFEGLGTEQPPPPPPRPSLKPLLPKTWVALGKFLGEFVYLAVEICHRWTLLSATSSFQVRKNFENRQKHQRRRSAWVGQADFGKLQLNNRNYSGKCQRLVMNVIHLKHDQFKINSVKFSDLCEDASTRLSFAISSFFRKPSTGKDFTRL